MRRIGRHACRLALVAALLSAGGAAFPRGGDDDDDLVEMRQAEQKGQMAIGGVGRIMISERNIESWIYGNQSRGRGRLEASLKQKVDEMGRICGLSDMQKQKLNLAGEGDIQRFESRVEEVKAKCQTGGIRPEQYNDIFQKTRPLRAALERGLFGNASLFHKMLLSTLRPEQVALCEQIERERRTYRYRARVELCVAQLDALVGLRDDQRRRLVQLVLDKTRPPKVYGQFERFIVLAQMSRIPEETLKSVFDPGQWREIQKRLMQGKRLIPALKQSGVLFDDDEEPAKEAEGGSRRPQMEGLRN